MLAPATERRDLRPLANSRSEREAMSFANKKPKGLFTMAEHKFKIGQVVCFRPKKSRLVFDAPPGHTKSLGDRQR